MEREHSFNLKISFVVIVHKRSKDTVNSIAQVRRWTTEIECEVTCASACHFSVFS